MKFKKVFFSFLCALLLFSCNKNIVQQYSRNKINSKKINIELQAVDLSENMEFSTKNDEIVFLIYNSNNKNLPQLLYKKYIVFDNSTKKLKLSIDKPKKMIP